MTDIKELQNTWNEFGRTDPLWAILSDDAKAGGKWDSEEFFATGRKDIDWVVGHIRSLGVDLPAGPALDFGCGVGRLSQALAEHFDSVVGVDIAASMIEEAGRRNRHPGRVRYVRNDRDDLSQFPDGSFGFAFSMLVLQHMQPRYSKRYIAEFARIVRPGGLFVFQMPGRRPASESVKLWVRNNSPKPLLRAYQRARHGDKPTMDFYPVPAPRIRSLVASTGSQIVGEHGVVTGKGRTEHFYFCRKGA
jgi:SAM-dependent methyltransferase